VMGSALVLSRFIQIGGLVAKFDFGLDPAPDRRHRKAGWTEISSEIRSGGVSFFLKKSIWAGFFIHYLFSLFVVVFELNPIRLSFYNMHLLKCCYLFPAALLGQVVLLQLVDCVHENKNQRHFPQGGFNFYAPIFTSIMIF
jgi:hypothetical protein